MLWSAILYSISPAVIIYLTYRELLYPYCMCIYIVYALAMLIRQSLYITTMYMKNNSMKPLANN